MENSNRSQMAQAFARIHGGECIEAHSAGSRPSGVVNPRAIEAMRERGYDLSGHTSKSLDDLPVDVDGTSWPRWAAATIAPCCGRGGVKIGTCPIRST